MKNTLTIALEWMVAIVTLPLMALNMVGGIVAFIWLAILGQWAFIIGGVLYIFLGYWFVSLMLMPGMIFLLPINYFNEKKNAVGLALFGLLNLAYVFVIIAVSSFYITQTFTDNLTGSNLVPLLIWSYSVAIAPWTYMASKEGRSDSAFDGTTTTLYFSQIGLIITLILVGFFHKSLLESFYIFGWIMIIPLLLSTVAAFIYAKQEYALHNDNQITETSLPKGTCRECSYRNVEHAKFCKNCGTKLD